MRTAGQNVRQNFGNAVDRIDDELDAELVSECLHEVELRSRRAIRTFDIRNRAVSRHDAQLARFEDLVQQRRGRRTGTE